MGRTEVLSLFDAGRVAAHQAASLALTAAAHHADSSALPAAAHHAPPSGLTAAAHQAGFSFLTAAAHHAASLFGVLLNSCWYSRFVCSAAAARFAASSAPRIPK